MLRLVVKTAPNLATRPLSTTSSCFAGRKWRESQGMGRSGNEYGPLTDNPDWSFADGRPAPLGASQIRRRDEQRALAESIDILSKEMLKAKVTYQEKLDAERKEEERRAGQRLKQKGSAWKQEGYVKRRAGKSSPSPSS